MFIQPTASLIRLVRAPNGRAIADIHSELPSENSLYLGAHPDVWRRAVKHDLASTWFGEPTILDTQTLTQLQVNLLKAIMQTLALSHKSGSVILGLEAVLSALEERETELVILATDAGGSDKKKLLRNPLTARYCHEFSTRTELGGLFKRRAQVYLAVREGALAQKCTHYLRLYTRFNGCDAL